MGPEGYDYEDDYWADEEQLEHEWGYEAELDEAYEDGEKDGGWDSW